MDGDRLGVGVWWWVCGLAYKRSKQLASSRVLVDHSPMAESVAASFDIADSAGLPIDTVAFGLYTDGVGFQTDFVADDDALAELDLTTELDLTAGMDWTTELDAGCDERVVIGLEAGVDNQIREDGLLLQGLDAGVD